MLDVVTRDSSSFIATRDNPGKCPGEGWQMLACGGKRGPAGDKGERGERGPKGERGDNGVGFASFANDKKNFKTIAKMTDGSEVTLDLREFFEQYLKETR
jgi:hypothetical protein